MKNKTSIWKKIKEAIKNFWNDFHYDDHPEWGHPWG